MLHTLSTKNSHHPNATIILLFFFPTLFSQKKKKNNNNENRETLDTDISRPQVVDTNVHHYVNKVSYKTYLYTDATN